jgi:hypothetical protein
MPRRNGITVTLAALLALAGSATLVSRAADGQSAAPGATGAPRTADGHPDFSGYWTAGPPPEAGGLFTMPARDASGNIVLNINVRHGDVANLTNDNVISRRSGNNLPLYKPEHWETVLDNDLNGNINDPYNSCMPAAPPRLGPPARIIQTPTALVLQYTVIFHRNEVRIVPIGPRTHPVDRDGSWEGDPVAHWDGDTLVIETIGFNDQGWIGPEGYVHGYDLKVVEKLRFDGNAVLYDATAEDPEYLQQPWVLPTQRLNRISNPAYRIEPSPPCSERDNKHMVGKNREM